MISHCSQGAGNPVGRWSLHSQVAELFHRHGELCQERGVGVSGGLGSYQRKEVRSRDQGHVTPRSAATPVCSWGDRCFITGRQRGLGRPSGHLDWTWSPFQCPGPFFPFNGRHVVGRYSARGPCDCSSRLIFVKGTDAPWSFGEASHLCV